MPTTDSSNVLTIIRRFKAPQDRVFAAFTSYEGMAKWFGPPGCDVQSGSVDFQVGGRYRLVVKTPNGEAIIGGAYSEIVPPEKIVFSWRWENDEDWTALESTVTIEFHAQGSETELRLTQIGFPSAESRGHHEHGWTGCFTKLDALVA